MKCSLALGCILLLGFLGWVAQDARALSPTPTPITPMPDFVPKNYVPQSVTMFTNMLRNFGFGADDFGSIENWAQTSIDLQRWYLVQDVLPDQPNARWVDRVALAPEEQGYALRSTDGQTCNHYCSTEAVQIVAAEENAFYVLSASARVAKGTAGLYLDFLDADRSRIQPHTRGGYTDRWTWQTVAAKAPPGTRYIRVILYTGDVEQATVYWRDVRLHRLSAGLTPMPPEGTNVAVEKRVIARGGGITYPDWGHANDAADFNSTTLPDGGRWGNQTNQGTFETVDLGSLYNLVGVGYSIDWDASFRNPLTFQAEVSPDNVRWTTVATVIHQPVPEGGGTVFAIDIPIDPIVGRYVRYSEPADGEWNGWGDFFHLRAYAVTERAISTVSLTTTTPAFQPTGTLLASPDFGATLTLQATTTLSGLPTPVIRPTWTPARKLAVGGKATVHVIRDDTLSVRSNAGIQNTILEKLADGTVVTLLEGPVAADGYLWWRVRTPRGTNGWAVESADGIQTLIP